MTNLLIRLFIERKQFKDEKGKRTAISLMASVVGIVCNLILCITKIVAGMLLNSISVMADGFNNLSDATSSIISFIGAKLANRPADKEHPFGHGRYEYISALIVAFLVLEVGLNCLKSSVGKIIHPEQITFQWAVVILLIISVFVKVWMGFFYRRLGSIINSTVLKATSGDAFSDVFITSTTIISLFVAKFTGLRIDGYVGVVVSIFVLIAGFNIAKETLEPLIGEAVSTEDYERITNFVEKHEMVMGTHDLILHNYGPNNIMGTIHVEIPHSIDVEKAHDIIDSIEREILKEMDIYLVIHLDPVADDDEMVAEYKNMVKQIISELDKNASMHDFRVVKGETYTNFIFDLVVPHSYSVKQEEDLAKEITLAVRKKSSLYDCSITVEHGYIAPK